MKVPLTYQTTEYDCGPSSLINVLNYLFEREEIHAKILKIVNKNTLDKKDKQGQIGQGGTSEKAICKILKLIKKDINIKYKIIEKENITLEKIKDCTKNKGVCLLKTYLEDEHYVIITKLDQKYAYIFDPYYLEKTKYNYKQVKIIKTKPFCYNRKVTIKRLISEKNEDFSLGKKDKRWCILINKLNIKI